MPIDTTIAETVLNNRETVTNIRRFAIGALMAASIPLGIPAIIATGAFCVGLNSAAFSMETRMREKKLVDFYKDETAAFLNKSPDAVTMDDLRQAAKPVEQGGKNIIILQNELNEQKTNQKFRFLNSVASSLVTTGALVGLSLAIPGFISGAMSMLLGLGLIGLGHNLVSRTVKGLSRLIFGPHDIENTVSQRLIHISEDIKHKPVTPIEIFTLLVDTHPELQAEIKQKYGKPYADLPVIQKKQVTESYEEQLRVIGLTEEINNGNIRPSLAGFIISHQLDEKLPDYHDFKALFNMPAARIKDRPQDMVQDYGESAYAKRLLAERAEGSPSKSLH